MDWKSELKECISRLAPDKVVYLTDSNVARYLDMPEAIVVPAGEPSKSIAGLETVWQGLIRAGATRHSLLVNIGGGVVTDLGGFAAGTYKRGIRHINVPTTLLAMADAAIGGKTGIDYCGLKNEIGVFKMPERVIIDAAWLDTLPQELLRDGLAEVVKTTMLGSAAMYDVLLDLPEQLDADSLRDATEFSGRFKEKVVAEDPTEQGLRRILNLGHTAGHAFESLAALCGHPVSHGEAVAHGLLVTLILSSRFAGMDPSAVGTYASRLLCRHYSPLPAAALDEEKLLELMARDKKNARYGEVSFVLLRAIGQPIREAVVIDKTSLCESLRQYRSIMS